MPTTIERVGTEEPGVGGGSREGLLGFKDEEDALLLLLLLPSSDPRGCPLARTWRAWPGKGLNTLTVTVSKLSS